MPILSEPAIRDLFEALLRHPAQLAGHKVCGDGSTLLRFGLIAVISIVVFGFVLGTFAYGQQLWAAPLKLGAGLLFAGLICFPSLYIFSSLAGSTATAAKMGGLLGGAAPARFRARALDFCIGNRFARFYGIPCADLMAGRAGLRIPFHPHGVADWSTAPMP